MSKLVLPTALLMTLSCASAFAQTAGSLPGYCIGVQKLGNGSWNVKSDGLIDGKAYPVGTVFEPGAMYGGMNVAKQLTDNCIR